MGMYSWFTGAALVALVNYTFSNIRRKFSGLRRPGPINTHYRTPPSTVSGDNQ